MYSSIGGLSKYRGYYYVTLQEYDTNTGERILILIQNAWGAMFYSIEWFKTGNKFVIQLENCQNTEVTTMLLDTTKQVLQIS